MQKTRPTLLIKSIEIDDLGPGCEISANAMEDVTVDEPWPFEKLDHCQALFNRAQWTGDVSREL